MILNCLAFGKDLLTAVTSPRLHSQLLPDLVYVEDVTTLLYPTLTGIIALARFMLQ